MMKSLLKLFTFCLLLFGSGVQTAVAADTIFANESKLVATDGKSGDEFGMSVALDGKRMAVGASGKSMVYIYKFNGGGWQETAKIIGPSGSIYFGHSVSLDGNRLVVGDYRNDIIYIYELSGSTWSETHKINGTGGNLGFSVSLDGDRMAVGDLKSTLSSGKVYIYELSSGTWNKTQTLSEVGINKGFGGAVALDGNRLVVARKGNRPIYVYEFSGSVWTKSFIDNKGCGVSSLALDGDRLVAGSQPCYDAYFYELSSSGLTQKEFYDQSGAGKTWFGRAIALDGDILAIGIRNAVYVYTAESPKTLSVVVSGLSVGGEVDLDINGTSSTVKNGKTDTSVNMGESYSVGIAKQPAGGSCSLSSNSSGAMGGSDVVVLVECEQDSYTVGGTVTLPYGLQMTLQNKGGDDLTLTESGEFTFATAQANFTDYDVSISNVTPNTAICWVYPEKGQILSENVTNIEVKCSGGNIYGMAENVIHGTTIKVENSATVGSSTLTESISINKSGRFDFPTPLANGTMFTLSITESTPQKCLFNGTDKTYSTTLDLLNYIPPVIVCDGTGYQVKVNVNGLTSSSQVILSNAPYETAPFSNGLGQFPTRLADGDSYDVAVHQQVGGYQCDVKAPAKGTIAAADVTVDVDCQTTTKGMLLVNVSGLESGKTVVVKDKISGDSKTLFDNSTATLTSQPVGTKYHVVVEKQPAGQFCLVSSAIGEIIDVFDPAYAYVTCKDVKYTAKSFFVTGKVEGLASGQSLSLQNNGSDNLAISGNGGFVFATALFNHDKYNVVVSKQPTKQTCTVSNGSGEILGKTVSDIVVTCKANTAGDVVTVGGTLNGLNGGEVVIANSTVDVLKLTADGNFTFANSMLKGSSYFVYVKKQPTGQVCTVSNGSGTANANVSNVAVSCQKAPTAFSVGGTVSGLGSGKNVVLQNNGGDDVTMSANGTFTFATLVAVGQPYAVTVKTQPTGQTCTVGNAGGNIGSSNVNNVVVSCSDNAVEPPVPVDPSAPQSVPSLSEKALLLLMLVLATATAWFIRQRRLV